jgi:5-methyltetrahydropteroyltriglutamate--homocysteine methyltransferase
MTVIRSDVVGSLLRPEPLKEARPRWEAGELSAAGLKRIEDRAVDDAIRLQEDAGLDVVTDGELRCYAFFGHLIEALDGFDKFGGWAIPFHDDHGGGNWSSSGRWSWRSSPRVTACAPRSGCTCARGRRGRAR